MTLFTFFLHPGLLSHVIYLIFFSLILGYNSSLSLSANAKLRKYNTQFTNIPYLLRKYNTQFTDTPISLISRPISLLSNFSKILEKLIYSRLTKFLEKR